MTFGLSASNASGAGGFSVTDALDYLWPVVDSRTSIVASHVYSSWPARIVKQLTTLQWLAEVEASAHVLCPECGDHFEEVVVRPGPGGHDRSLIACPRHTRVTVPPDARRQWSVRIDSLVIELAKALQLSGKVKEQMLERVWRLGRLPWRGESRDILFARGFGWNDAVSLRGSITAEHRPIVLVPSVTPAPDYWHGRTPPVIALDQATLLDTRGIEVDPLAFASAVQEAEPPTCASEQQTITCEQLTLMIRRQIKAEHKTQLTDDVLVAARRQCGSLRKAAEYLSAETGQAVTKDQVCRAVKRAGGLAEIINASDSDSIVRTSPTARGRRKSKPRSTQP